MPTFDTPAPISARVDIVLGDIRFVTGDRADTVVEVEPIDPTRRLDLEAAAQVEITFTDGRLQVTHPKVRAMFTKRYGSVKVLVRLPAGSDVRGDTAQGECVVQGVVGSCRLKTAIGGLRVGQATEVRLRTSGGKVVVDHVTGRADVDANGDIRIRRIDGGAAVRSIGGDIRVGELGGGPADLYAAIGKVEVGVAQGIAVRLDARTSTGQVRDLLEPSAPGHPDRAVALRARCHGGDIVVRRAGAGHDTPHRAAPLAG
ncbi:DUF4097 family beta strand repeat-containing protein [Catellatospora coxensis]|uniref:Adhesin n=2 Tax=Catellatospora coxensis TaxID=310354 RepID=A0A8J3P5I6_9ACTN|nr:hypothetical protein Cco03nite_11270 [Catellatospora coxensis]